MTLPTPGIVSRLAVALLMPFTLVTVVSCSLILPGKASACGWMTSPPQPPSGRAGTPGRTMLALDRSNSTRASGVGAAARAPDYASALRPALERAIRAGDLVSIGTFDGSAGSFDIRFTDLATNPHQHNSDNERKAVGDSEKCLLDDLRAAMATPPTTAGSDVLGAVDAAAQALRGDGPGTRTVVLATDGLATVGCADITHATIGLPSEVDAIANLCAQRKELPPAMSGVALSMIGVGHPADRRNAPSTTQLDWLRQFWARLCHDMSAGRCDISTNPVALLRPNARRVVASVKDPAVLFPPPGQGVKDPGGRTFYELSATVLFDTDSARLRPEGVTAVTDLAARIPRTPGTTVEVDGYTDSRDTAEYNLDLSRRRAESVRQVLLQHGVGNVVTRGYGESQPLCTPEYHPDGTPDAQAMQCNRRVQVIVTTPS